MERGATERVEPGPVGVARHVEEPDAADQHVALVDAAVVELDGPHVAMVVPRRRLDRDAELQVRAQPELVDGLFEARVTSLADDNAPLRGLLLQPVYVFVTVGVPL